MKLPPFFALAICLLLPVFVCAEVKSASLRIPQPTAWVGERLPFFVDLRAKGSFSGAASFSLPDIPQTVIIKIGSPVVSSEEIDGESWFVQSHEFALFTQQSGSVAIPQFEVRFSHRDGFVGPTFDKKVNVPAATVEIRRPPGSEAGTFLVTTGSLEITESWDPQPGPTKPGAVFHRTISQTAQQMMGMALAPPSRTAPEGIRVYAAQPEVADQVERGDFIGKRRDTITYVMQKPGTWTLPAVTYVWWDPKREQFGSQKLPEVTFEVAAIPQAAGDQSVEEESEGTTGWILLLLILILGTLGAWRYRAIAGWLKHRWQRWNPPDRVAARNLLRACRKNDPKAAEEAWSAWRISQPSDFQPDHKLRTAVLEMQRQLFGPRTEDRWQGENLAAVFKTQRPHHTTHPAARQTKLPRLNP